MSNVKMSKFWRSIAELAQCEMSGVAIVANDEDETADDQRFYVSLRGVRYPNELKGYPSPESALVCTHRLILERARKDAEQRREEIMAAELLDAGKGGE